MANADQQADRAALVVANLVAGRLPLQPAAGKSQGPGYCSTCCSCRLIGCHVDQRNTIRLKQPCKGVGFGSRQVAGQNGSRSLMAACCGYRQGKPLQEFCRRHRLGYGLQQLLPNLAGRCTFHHNHPFGRLLLCQRLFG